MHIPLKAAFGRASIATRLWMGAGAVAIFIGTLFAALMVTPTDPHDQGKVGLDFIAFYTAGNFVRDGRSADLYDIKKVHDFQNEVAGQNGVDLGSAVGPWWNPPFYSWVFVPIAKFPYRQSLHMWLVINLVCAGTAAFLLCGILRKNRSASAKADPTNWRAWALVPVLMALSTPFIHALSHGQNTCTSLLLVTIGVVLWRKERAVLAGAVIGLLFYKPQLGAVLATMLVFNLGWRALAGMSITGALLLLATLALPGSLENFLHQMPKNLHFVQCVVPYLWDRHVTFHAFWRLLFQGMAAGEPTNVVRILSTLCMGAVGIALLRSALRARKHSIAMSDATDRMVVRDRLIAATIAATPLLMPFYFDYDQLLLAVPAVLFAADLARRNRTIPLPKADLWLMRIWPVQYFWMMLNPDVATHTRVNVCVVLLTGIVSILIVRAGRNGRVVSEEQPKELTPPDARLAA